MSNAVSPKNIAASLVEFWSPRVIAEVDDAFIKVAKLHGSLAWHSPDEEDELFLVLKGICASSWRTAPLSWAKASC